SIASSGLNSFGRAIRGLLHLESVGKVPDIGTIGQEQGLPLPSFRKAPPCRGCNQVRSVAYRVSSPALGFSTIPMTIYNDVSTTGGTTKVLVTVEGIQRSRSWKTYCHTSRRCCGKLVCRLPSTLVMKPHSRVKRLFGLNVGGNDEGRELAPAPMA